MDNDILGCTRTQVHFCEIVTKKCNLLSFGGWRIKRKRLTMRNILYLITFFLCFNAFSQEHAIYTYRQKDSTLIITGKGTIQYLDVNKFKDKCVRVEIKEGIKGIQFFSFSHFELMKEIKFPTSLEFIGKNTFCSCTSLESVAIPPKVRLLVGSFTNCDNLKSITFPDTFGVELRSFDGCRSLKRLSFKYLSVFNSSHLEKCVSIEAIDVSDSTCHYKTRDGVLYEDDRVVVYPYAKKDKWYRFPDSIKVIDALMNPYIEEIYVPDDMREFHLYSCENLKKIRSENKIFYDRSDGDLKMDSLVIQVKNKKRNALP